ncbi:class I adenylate-forming enzyme family protein [Pseudomonas typographi]|uniref:Acyl--CoA ligase n=1 Tax=Pseudomonas typographi TaxID=2715964 RepID=A0ABR7YY38_9PSED|nr:class I adenylate-forming enzyme family protein [Pseudomonas typographi]MBD1550436.1 acyl--CoA ligase [Pseudomonas typographi]MBD1598095.1 acyl--CoA ligase [Pseudomonas typographi]
MKQVEQMPASVVPDERDVRHASYYRRGFWRTEDLWASVYGAAARHPEKVALIEDDRSLTFDQLIGAASRLAGGMHRQGLRPGDLVLIQARNSIDATLSMLACACLGAVMAPIPPMFSASQIAAICGNADARMLIALGEPKEITRAIEGVQAAGTTTTLVVPDDYQGAAHACTWSQLSAGTGQWLHAPVDAQALALLVYSSGTTGTPKGVMHSANTLRFAIVQRALAQQVSVDDICLVAAQFGFVGSAVFGLLACAVLGLTTVVMRSWNGDDALRLIARHRITYGLLMPTHVHDLLHSPLLGEVDVASFRHCSMSGLSREQRLAVRERLCPQPFAAYGMSECLGLASSRPQDTLASQLGSDGAPLPGNEVRIVDARGEALPSGEVGEILVRGPCCFLGYYGNPSLTSKTLLADGWLRTGDLGRLDADGHVVYVAREKDVIRRGGVNIYPGDTEAVLVCHPRIEHVALVGYPDERLGERACACVITCDKAAITLAELCAWLESRGVARYAWPERVAHFDSFPRSASLKVQKAVLAQWLQEMAP